MAVLVPSISVFCLIIFTSEAEFRLDINRRCGCASSLEEDGLQGWLRHIFKDWSVFNENVICQIFRKNTLLDWTVARNMRYECLTDLSWVVGIIVKGWRWNVRNQASVSINRNNLTKWHVGNSFFHIVFCYISTLNVHFIGIIT